MEKPKYKHLACNSTSPLFFFSFLLFSSFIVDFRGLTARAQNATSAQERVGVVLDLSLPAGKRSRISMLIAIEDFYAANPNFKTRVSFDFRDSMNDTVGAASAVVDLVKTQVQAIMGPQTSTETEFVAHLCDRAQVPLLSFSSTTPSISSSHFPYFIRACLNDSSQSVPIATFVHHFGWRAIVPVYEDSNYGSGILPFLVDALQPVDVRIPDRAVISSTATDDQIEKELYRLMNSQTRVFLVHMLYPLATRLFSIAQKLEIMSDGYVWIVTDSVGYMLDTLDSSVLSSMQGVVGFRPYVPLSNKIRDFYTRFKLRYLQDYPGSNVMGTNVYQYWTYDATWAMAMAVEMANVTNPSFLVPRSSSMVLDALGVSKTGMKLLNAIHNTTFDGLAGNFTLVDGQLQLPGYEIFNVIGTGTKTVGFWTQEAGITSEYKSSDNNNNKLKTIIWPGDDSKAVPKGWVIPTKGKTLQIAVPVKYGFAQFVNVSEPISNNSKITGYCIDVFDAVMKKLPYHVSYKYVPYNDSAKSYDNFVYQVYLNNFDAIVGDTTIIANRMNYVDYTLPYTDSGVSMIVPVKPDTSKTMWIFLQPLTAKLWLTSLAFFFFTGIAVWLIEHRINKAFRGTKWEQVGLIFYFSFSTLVFAHTEKLQSNLSRFLVIIWVFVVLILTSSYTASLTSMLTVQQLTPTITDVNELLRRGDYIGYQNGSFVVALLKRLNFDPTKMRSYNTVDEYAEALANGSANGGVSAIFDEIPYLKVFLGKYCSNHTMVGPTYKTDGFGFVFPRGSPLVADVSRAILNVSEGDEMTQIEKKWFCDPITCPSQISDLGSSSLSFRSFAGLFIITGVVSSLMIIIFLVRYVHRNWDSIKGVFRDQKTMLGRIHTLSKNFDRMDSSVRSELERKNSMVNVNEENQILVNRPDPIKLPDGVQNNDNMLEHSSQKTSPSVEGTRTQQLTHQTLPEEQALELQQIPQGR
ncbi:hypothetical protein LUZ60_000774 [Juncus effusus]|nr:hypothetical protein LUZ60_000774 [Juncus effusus]